MLQNGHALPILPILTGYAQWVFYNLGMNDYNPLKLRRRASRAKPYKIHPPVKQGFDGKVIPSNSKDRVKYWRVTLSARATGTGRQRFFFDTEREALDWVSMRLATEFEGTGKSLPGKRQMPLDRKSVV